MVSSRQLCFLSLVHDCCRFSVCSLLLLFCLFILGLDSATTLEIVQTMREATDMFQSIYCVSLLQPSPQALYFAAFSFICAFVTVTV
jgi:hypothetical protein